MKDFYVYLHRKATTDEVFYVGKGRGYRANVPKRNNVLWHSIAAKHGYVVEFAATGLQEWFAFELEKDLIALHGRRDLGLGPLANFCDGGKGAAGVSEATQAKKRAAATGFKHSEETKARLREMKLGQSGPNKGVPRSAETKRKLRAANLGKASAFKGRAHTQETRQKQREAKLGKQMSDETVAKIKASRTCVAICMDGTTKFSSFAAAVSWLQDQGFEKAAYSSLRMACKGLVKQAYGHTWQYA